MATAIKYIAKDVIIDATLFRCKGLTISVITDLLSVMIALRYALILVSLLCVSLSARVWTDRDGREVIAEFVSLKDGLVYLRLQRDDVVYAFPFERLSAEDRQFARSKVSMDASGSASGAPPYHDSSQTVPVATSDVSPGWLDNKWIRLSAVSGKDANGVENKFATGVVYLSQCDGQWTEVFRGGNVADFSKVKLGNKFNKLVAGNDTLIVAGAKGNIFVTRNGKDWASPDPLKNSQLLTMTFYENRFWLLISDGSFQTSTNGLDWDTVKFDRAILPEGKYPRNIRLMGWGNDRMVLVGEQRISVANKEGWVHHTILPKEEKMNRNGMKLVHGLDRFILRHRDGMKISEDGMSWQDVDVIDSAVVSDMRGVNLTHDGSHFYLFFRHPASALFKSRDGLSWELIAEKTGLYNMGLSIPGILSGRNKKGRVVSRDEGESWEAIGPRS